MLRLFDLKQTNSHKSFSFHLTNSVWPQGHWRPSIQTIFIWVNQCVKRQLRGQQARLIPIETGNNTQQQDATDADLAFISKITETFLMKAVKIESILAASTLQMLSDNVQGM